MALNGLTKGCFKASSGPILLFGSKTVILSNKSTNSTIYFYSSGSLSGVKSRLDKETVGFSEIGRGFMYCCFETGSVSTERKLKLLSKYLLEKNPRFNILNIILKINVKLLIVKSAFEVHDQPEHIIITLTLE
jgi:hypothetical protein